LDEIDVIDEEDNDNEEIKEDPTIYEVEFEKMMSFLAEFSSQDEPDALKFLGLTNNQRKSLHISCTRLKLKSESIGEGQIKETIVFRKEKKIKKMSTSTTQKKEKKYSKIPLGMTEIIPNFLYLGSLRDARNKEELDNKKISNTF